MKKSELMKIIKEEVEVVLTNEEVVEFFDLDLAALLEAEISHQVGKSPTSIRKTSTASNWERGEKKELQDTIKRILEDGTLSNEEQVELRLVDSIESLVSEVLEAVSIEDPDVSDKFMKASEAYRSQLRNIVQAGTNETPVNEAWKGDPEIDQTGEYADKTKEELCVMKKKLMDKEKRTAAEQKKVRQINFALRSKQKGPKFGKVGC